MQKIIPFLWFNDNAEEAVAFYASIFRDGKIGKTLRYDEASAEVSGRPEGSVMTIAFELCGQEFGALNGGPIFKFTPAVSFFVQCETEEQIDALWNKLSDGGKVLMEYQKYPFAEKYGWLSDTYGVSWQLMLSGKKQSIAPAFLFVGDRYGKAEEAIHFYVSLFEDSQVNMMSKRGPDNTPPGETEGTLEYASFTLAGQDFAAMEGKKGHTFDFTPAISFAVNCESQEEIDHFWNALSAVKEAEQCGWLQDRFGISWQIVPTVLEEMLADKDPEKAKRVMKAMLGMGKMEIGGLERAYGQ